MRNDRTNEAVIESDNAARRISYQGAISLAGMTILKEAALKQIPGDLARHHMEGRYHIHDIEAFGIAPNCLSIDFRRCFPTDRYRAKDPTRRLLSIFDFIRQAIVAIACDQSGGIGFVNFDDDIAWACDQLAISDSPNTRETLCACVEGLIDWVNTTRSRYGLECYYVTLNVGLSLAPLGRHVTTCLLKYICEASAGYVCPNIVFKTLAALHLDEKAPNRSIFDMALAATAVRMIPTYQLCDAESNKKIPPDRLAIMGCRTRVAENIHGPTTAIGRGNMAYISVNLPRIAWMLAAQGSHRERNAKAFLLQWQCIAKDAAAVLLYRKCLLERNPAYSFPGFCTVEPWLKPFADGDRVGVWKHATLSIGFIGLAEAVEILTGQRIGVSDAANTIAVELVAGMRREIDRLRVEHQCNITLLATSAESAAGRFARIDWTEFRVPAAEKGFYTNSFHVPVDIPLNPVRKMQIEGPFHALCNGGCISYVELSGPPFGNALAIEDILRAGASAGVSYFGVNFPRDVCNACGNQGIFDSCPTCASSDVAHIRRVSGYLEDLRAFTLGKQAEVTKRVAHSRGDSQCQ